MSASKLDVETLATLRQFYGNSVYCDVDKVDASEVKKTYARVLCGIYDTVRDYSSKHIDDLLSKMHKEWKTSKVEEALIRRALLIDQLVYAVFVTCQSNNTFLAACCVDELMHVLFSQIRVPQGCAFGMQPCIVRFEQGFVDHFNVRLSLARVRPAPRIKNGINWQLGQAHVHLDPGTRIYENSGVEAMSIYYGTTPEGRKEMNFMDEATDEAKSKKKRMEVLHQLWSNTDDKKKFFVMVCKSVPLQDRMAVTFSLGMLHMLQAEPWKHEKVYA